MRKTAPTFLREFARLAPSPQRAALRESAAVCPVPPVRRRFYAAVALDPNAGRIVRVAGDTKSPRELAAIFETVRGKPVELKRAGSIDDLSRAIDAARAADRQPGNPFPRWQQMQYTRDMASGRGKLSPLDNDRYPAVHPRGVKTFLQPQR